MLIVISVSISISISISIIVPVVAVPLLLSLAILVFLIVSVVLSTAQEPGLWTIASRFDVFIHCRSIHLALKIGGAH